MRGRIGGHRLKFRRENLQQVFFKDLHPVSQFRVHVILSIRMLK